MVVNCYDRERGTVSVTLASECRGTAISDAEARAIRDQRDRDRMRAVTQPRTSAPGGLRLASIGTAFYVDERGRLLTNRHVIAACVQISLRPAGGDDAPATVLAIDEAKDLAVLQGVSPAPGVAAFRADVDIAAGAAIAAVGYPDQGLAPLAPVLIAGSFASALSDGTLIVKGEIRHGSSGGPILDEHGLVIGIMRAKIDTARLYAATGREIRDVGIGIAAAEIGAFLKRTDTDFRTSPAVGDGLPAAAILDLARRFVARVDCWK